MLGRHTPPAFSYPPSFTLLSSLRLPSQAVGLVLLYVVYVALVIVLRYYIQPYFPDDSFGVYMSGKAEPTLRAIRRAAGPLARRAQVAARPLSQKLRPASDFLAYAGQSLLRATEVGSSASAGPGTNSVSNTAPLQCGAGLQPLPVAVELAAADEADTSVAVGGVDGGGDPPDDPPGGGSQLVIEGGGIGELPGSAGQPALLGSEGGEPMGLDGLDYPADASLASRAMWLLELPLCLMRWGTICSDSEWDERRRMWATGSPPFAMALLMVEVCGGIAESWEARMLGIPVIILAPLLASPLPWALRKRTRGDIPPRGMTTLVICGFCMTIVWLDLLATEVRQYT